MNMSSMYVMRSTLIAMLAVVQMGVAAVVHADEMNQAQHHRMHQSRPSPMTSPLSEAGNDAFATIQEVVEKLGNDPATDWSKVDLEALRQHLIDMHNFTLDVEVLSKQAIDRGVRIVIRPTTLAAEASLDRVLPPHAAQLKRETGWQMHYKKEKQAYFLEVITSKPGEIEQICGLGYIGIMATGSHHQLHHWLMVTGQHPHAGDH